MRNYVIVGSRMAEELNKIESNNNSEYEWSHPSFSMAKKPKKLVSKVRMQNTVIDEEGSVFHYYFIDGKIVYQYFCQINPSSCDVSSN